jgi:hypothetical protein
MELDDYTEPVEKTNTLVLQSPLIFKNNLDTIIEGHDDDRRTESASSLVSDRLIDTKQKISPEKNIQIDIYNIDRTKTFDRRDQVMSMLTPGKH